MLDSKFEAMKMSKKALTDTDLQYLEYCLKLAEKAVDAGDEPFGSVLVNEKNEIIAEARNRVNEQTELAHPEFELAKWAGQNVAPEKRKYIRMYTSGEHCPMCSAAHGWVGLGEIVYLSSGKQLSEWLAEMGASASPVKLIPVEDVITNVEVRGPAEGELLEKIKALHARYHRRG